MKKERETYEDETRPHDMGERVGKDAEHVSVSAANDDRSPVLRRNSDRVQCSQTVTDLGERVVE